MTLPGRRRAATPEPYLQRLQTRMARGESLEEAARHYGLELWQAKATFVRSGLPLPKPIRHRRVRNAQERALGARIHVFLDRNENTSAAQVAAALGVTRSQVQAALWPQDAPRLLPALKADQRFPRAGILIALQSMSLARALETGARGRVPVSAAYWDAHRDTAVQPSAATVRLRFDGWRAACEAAGVPVSAVPRGVTTRTWTDDDCWTAVRTFFAGGHGWGSAHYAAWSRGKDVPSVTTVLNRLGSWPALRTKVIA